MKIQSWGMGQPTIILFPRKIRLASAWRGDGSRERRGRTFVFEQKRGFAGRRWRRCFLLRDVGERVNLPGLNSRICRLCIKILWVALALGGSVAGVLPRTPKGCWFDPQLGRAREATDGRFSLSTQ